MAKKPAKKKVERREALSYDVLLGAYKGLNCDCTVHELAKKLGRPHLSVGMRFNKMIKVFAAKGQTIKPLKRKNRQGSDVDELIGKYADVMSAIETPKAPEESDKPAE
jgi:hypothetical protein